ncbi:DUF1127 domain-containing protein [Marinomonas sp. GJ51-6]|uniref:DUF1127 domain-containing protein n=1 Tax=Marinomonas sp. GJ51-6 TaxID=2992802 RepID=UPI002934D098|nr:DUF1127 domain-containing protein [Marinomonas sp. GJ51-6]WOD07642.1 DUF1127 domain-containing protein [Marinomonas sp. GJ51-6]
MKTHSSHESSVLESSNIKIEACCKSALDNLKKNTWRKLLAKIVHNWKTRSRLKTLSDAQLKDLGLTSSDVYNEVHKPLWK